VNRDKIDENLHDKLEQIRILEKLEKLVKLVEKALAACHSRHNVAMIGVEECGHPDCKEMREALE